MEPSWHHDGSKVDSICDVVLFWKCILGVSISRIRVWEYLGTKNVEKSLSRTVLGTFIYPKFNEKASHKTN